MHGLNHAVNNSKGKLVLQEALARNNSLDEIPEAFVGAGHFLADLVDTRAVAAVEFTPDGVGEHFLGAVSYTHLTLPTILLV